MPVPIDIFDSQGDTVKYMTGREIEIIGDLATVITVGAAGGESHELQDDSYWLLAFEGSVWLQDAQHPPQWISQTAVTMAHDLKTNFNQHGLRVNGREMDHDLSVALTDAVVARAARDQGLRRKMREAKELHNSWVGLGDDY